MRLLLAAFLLASAAHGAQVPTAGSSAADAALAGSSLAPQALWQAWPSTRFVTTPAPCLRPAQLDELLASLATRHPGALVVEEVGRSVEGRPIRLLRLGSGPRRVLLWSQMHGDEPSATPALLDLADYLLTRSERPEVRGLLERLTLLLVPMLNPDGTERYERRNAQAIDVNRDALNLTTPEGRLLKSLRDRFEPELGFNLHDQNRRYAVGESGRLATLSLLAVSGDAQGTLTPGRLRAKRACGRIVETLAPLLPEGAGIGRYDEDWSPRAFGDNLTAWGTPVVLIESGGAPQGQGLELLTRLNFAALGATLDALARDDLAQSDPVRYDELPRNAGDAYADLVLRNGHVFSHRAGAYRADLAFNAPGGDLAESGCPGARERPSRVVELGDARFLAGPAQDVTGALLVPAFSAAAEWPGARAWLSPEALQGLARLGVGRLVIEAAAADLEAARAAAATPARRLRIEVRSPSETADARPALRLRSPPPDLRAEPGAGALLLVEVMKALAGPETAERLKQLPAAEALALLCGDAFLRTDARASLVILRGAAGRPLDPERLDLGPLALDQVFLDGQRER
ncbi:MAG: M14 family zinc carboxypeptidase [Vicinamibacteria bacterium]